MLKPVIANLTVFADASFCHLTKAAGGAFWARAEDVKAQDSFAFRGAEQSHDSEVMVACEAILRISQHPELGKVLALGPKTRLVLVIDCLTVKQVLEEGRSGKLCKEAHAMVDKVRMLRRKLNFWLKVNHVKAHSGKGTPRQWVNSWCDTNARARMTALRDAQA
jgi:hypothetical protein